MPAAETAEDVSSDWNRYSTPSPLHSPPGSVWSLSETVVSWFRSRNWQLIIHFIFLG